MSELRRIELEINSSSLERASRDVTKTARRAMLVPLIIILLIIGALLWFYFSMKASYYEMCGTMSVFDCLASGAVANFGTANTATFMAALAGGPAGLLSWYMRNKLT